MTDGERARFDALVEEVLEELPARVRALLDEVPLIVDDRPEPGLAQELYAELGHPRGETLKDFVEGLCGLHSGVPLTERSVEHSGAVPADIRIFREGIVNTAGGWDAQEGESDEEVDDAVFEEIWVTVLHEIGHHFGLDEADLDALGYG